MDPSTLVGIRWVHLFESDVPEGAVYRPDSEPFPLSRRPREALTLHADGTATLETGGPDDRPVARGARWKADPDGVAIAVAGRKGAPALALRIVDMAPDRLVIAPVL